MSDCRTGGKFSFGLSLRCLWDIQLEIPRGQQDSNPEPQGEARIRDEDLRVFNILNGS